MLFIFITKPSVLSADFSPTKSESMGMQASFFFNGGGDFNLIWPKTKAYLYAEHLYVICFGFAGKLGISRKLPRLSYTAQPSSLNTCSNDKKRLSVKIVQL